VKPTYALDEALDAALDCRVELHEQRQKHAIDVPTYLEGLRQVREVEDALEPLRRGRGARTSRALELSRAEKAEST
jgi:hypothetical protein